MNIKQTKVAKFMQFSMKTMRSKSRAWKIGLCGHWAELLVTGLSNGRRSRFWAETLFIFRRDTKTTIVENIGDRLSGHFHIV